MRGLPQLLLPRDLGGGSGKLQAFSRGDVAFAEGFTCRGDGPYPYNAGLGPLGVPLHGGRRGRPYGRRAKRTLRFGELPSAGLRSERFGGELSPYPPFYPFAKPRYGRGTRRLHQPRVCPLSPPEIPPDSLPRAPGGLFPPVG